MEGGFYTFPVVQPESTKQTTNKTIAKNYNPCASCKHSHLRCEILPPYSAELCKNCEKKGRTSCLDLPVKIRERGADGVIDGGAGNGGRENVMPTGFSVSTEQVLSETTTHDYGTIIDYRVSSTVIYNPASSNIDAVSASTHTHFAPPTLGVNNIAQITYTGYELYEPCKHYEPNTYWHAGYPDSANN